MDDATQDKVRQRAYELSESRAQGGKPGDPVSDWLDAERQIVGRGAEEESGRRGVRVSRRTTGR